MVIGVKWFDVGHCCVVGFGLISVSLFGRVVGDVVMVVSSLW